MGEGKRSLWSFGAGNDYSHLLRFLDDGEKFVYLNPADAGQKLKAETAPDHRGSSQLQLFILVEPLQPPTDDQPHVFRYVSLGDLYVGAELPRRIKDFPLFDQMPVHLLDEKGIPLAFLKDEAYQTFRSL